MIIDEFVHTSRLLLKKLTPNNLEDYFEIARKDEVGKWLATSRGKTYEETQAIINVMLKQWDDKKFGVWGVFEKATEKLAGHCGLNYIASTGEVELIYALDPTFWGNGYASEAAATAINYAFEKIKLDRIIALTKPENLKSRKVLQKNGFDYITEKEYFGCILSYFELRKPSRQ